jgi:hypothetical protein
LALDQISGLNYHDIENSSPEQIEDAVVANLHSENFEASETFLAKLGYLGDSFRVRAIETGRLSVSHCIEISRFVEDKRRLKLAVEKSYRAATDPSAKVEIGDWLRKLGVSEALKAEIDETEFSQLWISAGLSPFLSDVATALKDLFWSCDSLPGNFGKFVRLAGYSERAAIDEFGVAAVVAADVAAVVALSAATRRASRSRAAVTRACKACRQWLSLAKMSSACDSTCKMPSFIF